MIKIVVLLSFLQFMFVSVNGGGVGVPVVGKMTGPHPAAISHLYNYHNLNYYGKIWIGTPKDGEQRQEFTILFDTGSVDLIVNNFPLRKSCDKMEDVKRKENCEKNEPRQYHKSKSKTCQQTPGTFTASYLDTTKFDGHIAHEYLEIGDGESKIRVKARIGLADSVENEISDSDGVFGLGFGTGSSFEPSILSAIECVFAQTDIPPQIGYYVRKGDEEEKDVYRGEIYFGGYNRAFVDSDFTAPVPAAGTGGIVYGWDMDLKEIRIGENVIDLEGVDLDGNGVTGTQAVPDTGTSCLVINSHIFDEMIFYIFPGGVDEAVLHVELFLCGLLPSDLPDITFVVNEKVSLTLGPENYVWSTLDGMACRLTISRSRSRKLILGNTFLQRYYSVFDYQKKEMKFAKSKHPPIDEQSRQPGRYGKQLMSKYTQQQLQRLRNDLDKGLVPENLEHYFL